MVPRCGIAVLVRPALVAVALIVATMNSAPAATAASPPPASARLGRALDAWARPFVSAGQLSGNLLVVKGRSIVLERSWGAANVELGVPNRPDMRFNIASITKPMTILMA